MFRDFYVPNLHRGVGLVLLLLLLFASPSPALDLTAATDRLVHIIVNPNADLSRPGRAALVKALSEYCADVLTALPTNTPKEDEWVKAESNTTDTNRITRLLTSPEWGRKTLKEGFSYCLQTADEIAAVQSAGTRTEQVVRYEAASLVSVALTFNDAEDLVGYASRAGLDPNRFALPLLGNLRRTLLVAALRTLEERP